MLVGSAPNFPDGAVDPIFDLGQLAKKYKIGLHVDCCLGSFLMPFLQRQDRNLPNFDFSVDGVTAISCDIHKYGVWYLTNVITGNSSMLTQTSYCYPCRFLSEG